MASLTTTSTLLNEPGKWNYFISHVQADSGLFANDIFYSVRDHGKTCWLDVKMVARDEDAMKEGIILSEIVLIIMSPEYFTRPFCVKELEWAVEYHKPIQVVIDIQQKGQIGSIINRCPNNKGYLKGIGKINFTEISRVNPFLWKTSVDSILKDRPKILLKNGNVVTLEEKRERDKLEKQKARLEAERKEHEIEKARLVAEKKRREENLEKLRLEANKMKIEEMEKKLEKITSEQNKWEIDANSIEIRDYIGRGAFADVHKGIVYGMNVAIKKLHAHTSKKESEQAKLLLQNEFKTLSSCRHENIVQMFNICSDPPMLILAFAEKGNLRDLFDNEPTMSNEKRFHLACGICNGMAMLHSRNILHLDLKPENILISKDDVPWISDFGLSKIKTMSAGSTKGERGTIQYKAPELFKSKRMGGANYSKAADVYSFGILSWELFSGKIAFAGVPENEILAMHMEALMFEDSEPERPPIADIINLEDNEKLFITGCWSQKTEERPTFENLSKSLRGTISMMQQQDKDGGENGNNNNNNDDDNNTIKKNGEDVENVNQIKSQSNKKSTNMLKSIKKQVKLDDESHSPRVASRSSGEKKFLQNEEVANVTKKSAAYIKWEKEFDGGKAKVDLSGKNLTDEDALAIGELLKRNNTLKTLSLCNNNITDVQSIGEALKTNNTLMILNLYYNNITDDSGIQSIIDGLKINNTLKYLHLDNNQLSDNMKSQLKAIQQYKRDGSNGYQRVRRMEIAYK